ncbi:enoyl-CoA hydratase/isomerase family protein [Eubacteriales bacterium OttesenSCG-928-K08]|nr:enoyl-CoA hydratase/isomerase family protein [Eubacteriales bacterium OttesenSCG-928-K08]
MQYEGYTRLLFEKKGPLAYVTINRPEVHNALDEESWIEILRIFREINADKEIRGVIITGSGNRSFVSGADVQMLRRGGPLDVVNGMFAEGAADALIEVENSPKVVIAAVNGFAFGGGCELALAADFRVAVKKAQFGQLEINLGIIPGAGGTQRLPRLVGISKAKELILTGDVVSADEALKIGLANYVVETNEELIPFCEAFAAKIINKSPIAVQLAKKAVMFGANTDIASGLLFEKYSFGLAFASEDKDEGTAAFLEKRKPEFKGK